MMKKVTLSLFLLLGFLFLPQSALAQTSWTTTTLDSTGSTGQYTSMELGSDGFARISYYDGTNGDLKFVRCHNTTCSSPTITTVDSTGNVGSFTSMKLSSDGFARISYYDLTNGDLKFAQCTNDSCSTSNITTVDSTGIVGVRLSLALGNDGFARISYYDDTNDDLKYAQCTNAACTASNIRTIDATNNVGSSSSLAIGNDGFARIAYSYTTGDDLKYARCTNATCSSVNITTVDSTGSTGRFPSMVLGSDGFARIASGIGLFAGGLKFAQCTNDDCTTSNITTIEASGAASGQHSSIQLGSDGFARIVHTDLGDGLKFVQCSNADCSSSTTTVIDPDGSTGNFSSLAINSDGLARISFFVDATDDLNFAYEAVIPTPTQQQSNNTVQTSSNNSPSAPVCGDSKPVGSPDLFEVRATDKQATLYFAPVANTTEYQIAYGYTNGDERFGTKFNYQDAKGVLSYTINHLIPNTTYHLKVKAANGCTPGDWGNTMEIKTNKNAGSTGVFYKNFIARVASVLPRTVTNIEAANTPKKSEKNACEHTVQPGDSLWSISVEQYGTGAKYKEIMEKNNLPSTNLKTGQVLQLDC